MSLDINPFSKQMLNLISLGGGVVGALATASLSRNRSSVTCVALSALSFLAASFCTATVTSFLLARRLHPPHCHKEEQNSPEIQEAAWARIQTLPWYGQLLDLLHFPKNPDTSVSLRSLLPHPREEYEVAKAARDRLARRYMFSILTYGLCAGRVNALSHTLITCPSIAIKDLPLHLRMQDIVYQQMLRELRSIVLMINLSDFDRFAIKEGSGREEIVQNEAKAWYFLLSMATCKMIVLAGGDSRLHPQSWPSPIAITPNRDFLTDPSPVSTLSGRIHATVLASQHDHWTRTVQSSPSFNAHVSLEEYRSHLQPSSTKGNTLLAQIRMFCRITQNGHILLLQMHRKVVRIFPCNSRYSTRCVTFSSIDKALVAVRTYALKWYGEDATVRIDVCLVPPSGFASTTTT